MALFQIKMYSITKHFPWYVFNGNTMVFLCKLCVQRRADWLKPLIFTAAYYFDDLFVPVGPFASISLRSFGSTGEFIVHLFRWRPSFNASDSVENERSFRRRQNEGMKAAVRRGSLRRAARSLIRFRLNVCAVKESKQEINESAALCVPTSV